MAKDFKIQATLTADDQASAKVKQATGAFGELGKLLGKGGLIVAGAAAAAVAIGKVAGVAGDFISAAAQQEAAANQVATALRGIGEASPQAVSGFEEFASELQRVSTVGDETVLQMGALALSFTNSAEQAQQLTRAALDYSRGAGISFEESIRRLGRTMKGSVDDIAAMVPELKNLSKESLASGDAIAIVQERFAGFAAAEAKTFSGALQQIQNTLGDVAEAFGSAATENEALADVFQEVKNILASPEFEAALNTVVTILSAMVTVVAEVTKVLLDFIKPIISIVGFLGNLDEHLSGTTGKIKQFGDNAGAAKTNTEQFGTAANTAAAGIKAAGDASQTAGEQVKGATDEAKKAKTAFEELGIVTEKEAQAAVEKLAAALVKTRGEIDGINVTQNDYNNLQDATVKKIADTLNVEERRAQTILRAAEAQIKANAAQTDFTKRAQQYEIALTDSGAATLKLREGNDALSASYLVQQSNLEGLTEEQKNMLAQLAQSADAAESLGGTVETTNGTFNTFNTTVGDTIKAQQAAQRRADALTASLKRQETQANATTKALNNLASAQSRTGGGSAGLGTAGGS